MPLVRGGDPADPWPSGANGALAPDRVATLADQTLEARAAHVAGVIDCDVKPGVARSGH